MGGGRESTAPRAVGAIDDQDPKQLAATISGEFRAYLDWVPDDLQVLLRRYRYCDMAIKVVGVGSVGSSRASA